MRTLLLVFLIYLTIPSAILTLNKDGQNGVDGNYTTFGNANTAASAGDTIRIIGTHTKYVFTIETYPKANLKIIGAYDVVSGRDTTRDTFELSPGGISMLRYSANSGSYFENIVFRHKDSIGVASTNRLFRIANQGGFYFYNCIFESPNRFAGNLIGFEIDKTNNNTTTKKSVWERCYFWRVGIGFESVAVGRSSDSLYVIECFGDSSVFKMGSYTYIDKTILVGMISENSIGDSCHDITIDRSYLNAKGNNTGEFISSDDGTNKRYRIVFRNLTIDSGFHVEWSGDYLWNSIAENCLFIRGMGIYNHNDGAQVDSSGYNFQIKKCYFAAISANLTIASNSTDTMFRMVVDSSIIHQGSFNVNLVKNDTLRNTIFRLNNPTKTGWHYEDNITTNAGVFYLDTNTLPFIKYSSIYDENYGPIGRLFKVTDTTISSNFFSATCSLSINFGKYRRDNGVRGINNVFTKNSFFTGDTAKFTLIDSVPGGVWTKKDSVNVIAGNDSLLMFISPVSGDHYYRVVCQGLSNGVTHISDTTPVATYTITFGQSRSTGSNKKLNTGLNLAF